MLSFHAYIVFDMLLYDTCVFFAFGLHHLLIYNVGCATRADGFS
jgi:hypothetical protein